MCLVGFMNIAFEASSNLYLLIPHAVAGSFRSDA